MDTFSSCIFFGPLYSDIIFFIECYIERGVSNKHCLLPFLHLICCCRGNIKSEFSKKVCFSRISRLKVTYMFMALTNSLVVPFIAVLLQIF